ncbi:pilin, partial [Patescibacteria group bacterium]|nr:pilin [Patescibacteria group bacterium]
EKIKLGMPIGDMTEVGDLGTYVDVFYSWLLPAASLLAIVLIMIGGFQWAIARGDSSMVKKAKDRITKAVFGLLILFGVYAIAYLIDPRLTSFDQLRVPVIQTIIFIDENTTCENIYKAAGGDVSITPISGSSNIPICGDKGLISFEGKNTSILGVQTDDTCIYGWCDSDLERCVQIAGQSDVYSCLKCADIYSGGDFGITPSNSECSKMINFDIAQDYEDNNSYIYCKYLDAGLGVLNTDTCAELVYPNMAGNDVVNCDILKQDALASYGAATCRAYDNVSARTNGYTFEKEVDDLPGKDQDFPLLLEVCEDDPCNFAPDGGCHVVSYNPTFCTWPVISQIAFCQDIGRIIRADCVTQEFSDWLSDWYELTSNGVGLLEYDDFYLLLSEMPGIEGIDQNGDSVEIDFHKTIFN